MSSRSRSGCCCFIFVVPVGHALPARARPSRMPVAEMGLPVHPGQTDMSAGLAIGRVFDTRAISKTPRHHRRFQRVSRPRSRPHPRCGHRARRLPPRTIWFGTELPVLAALLLSSTWPDTSSRACAYATPPRGSRRHLLPGDGWAVINARGHPRVDRRRTARSSLRPRLPVTAPVSQIFARTPSTTTSCVRPGRGCPAARIENHETGLADHLPVGSRGLNNEGTEPVRSPSADPLLDDGSCFLGCRDRLFAQAMHDVGVREQVVKSVRVPRSRRA